MEEYEKQNPTKKEKNKLLLPFEIVIVLFGCSLICVVLLLFYKKPAVVDNSAEITRLKNNLKSNEEVIKSYKEDLNRLTKDESIDYLEEKLEFFDDNFVFRIEGYGNYYYSYDCMMKKVGNSSYTYWVYNREKAAVEGLNPGGC